MKKILAIMTVAGTMAGLSAMGQGYFNFNASTKTVWDGLTQSAMKVNANTLIVEVLWGSASSTPAVDAATGMTQTPTNGVAAANSSYNPAVAWAAILGDANFQVANRADSGSNAVYNVGNGGSIVAGTQNPVTGTSSGQNYNVYMVAWSNAYATPALAALAGAAVGWSGVIPYSAVSAISGAATISASASAAGSLGASQFGVYSVPEPASFALAGLGAAAMLIFRRRK